MPHTIQLHRVIKAPPGVSIEPSPLPTPWSNGFHPMALRHRFMNLTHVWAATIA